MKTIAQKIQESLEKKSLTQRELAEKVNVTEATISRYISGTRSPRGEILSRIAAVLGVTTDYLLGNSESSVIIDNEKDIEKVLNQTLDTLESQDGLMLSGSPVDDNDFRLIKMAIQNGIEYAKISNNKKKP